MRFLQCYLIESATPEVKELLSYFRKEKDASNSNTFFMNDGATAILSPSKYLDNAINIDAIITSKDKRKGGYGTKAMLEILHAAKKFKVNVTLQPQPSDEGMSIVPLTKWYESFGFLPLLDTKDERIMSFSYKRPILRK